MLKKATILALAIMTFNTTASVTNHSGEIANMRTWVSGSNTYGVWVSLKNNPSICPGGFYLPHTSDNKQLVYSTLLAARLSGKNIMIQAADSSTYKIGDRCRINYVML
ncbi:MULTISPECIES: hypothetical protein [Pseudoalteromonas]|uniref:hypothetical protein n=1 Tax=Pseudoalteromonas TaxID=53246 RepID=UPI0018919328|nr:MULTISPECIES: hypothetical protein [Pseudoalteromonas]MCG7562967.1 hypothetical protein [Pseudoalteromonas sp. McH1-42]MEC4087855.1 hypothetical protein [Pseudoalteromonas rubra]